MKTHKHRCGYVPNPRNRRTVHIFDLLELDMAREALSRLPTCGYVFEHARPQGVDEQTYRDAHRCPFCGTYATYVYKGRIPPGKGRKDMKVAPLTTEECTVLRLVEREQLNGNCRIFPRDHYYRTAHNLVDQGLLTYAAESSLFAFTDAGRAALSGLPA